MTEHDDGELASRISRVYAAYGSIHEGDLSKFPARIIEDEHRTVHLHDFSGSLSPAETSNRAHSLIHNLANLADHERRWLSKNKLDRSRVDSLISTSKSLQIVLDLSNNDKHGYPPRDGGRTGVSPRVTGLKQTLRLSTLPQAGSGIALIFGPDGPRQWSGSGSAKVIVTGDVVQKDGTRIGDLHEILLDALTIWEQELDALGIASD